jgi:hypothetical protein
VGKYAAKNAAAYALLSRKGGPVPVTRRSTSGFEPVTQQESSSTQTVGFVGVSSAVSKNTLQFDLGSLQFSSALQFDVGFNGVPAFEPRPGDTLTWKGNEWTIKVAQALDPAGDGAVFYNLVAVR